MKKATIAAIGITLAVSSTALMAQSFDASRGTYQESVTSPQVALEPMPQESTMAEESRASATIERREFRALEPREPMMDSQPQRSANYDWRHPHTGQLIERGLFNRIGPNDFGA